MKHTLPDSVLSQMSEFIATRMALHFPRERWSDLAARTGSAAKEFGYTDAEEFVRWLIASSLTLERMEIVASHLTVSETYFWREPQSFEALERTILPELIQSRANGERRIKIWSAGCCTGEEPYSIAIALDRLLPTHDDWNITILATDISSRILRKAALGQYGEWSFRNAPRWLKGDYFHITKVGKYEILPKIREMVTFEYLNLAEDKYPSPLNSTSGVDIIFCRNVLMYFSHDRVRQIGASLYNSLIDGGWLIVGASELSAQTFPQFRPVNFPGAIVYRKSLQDLGQRAQGKPGAHFALQPVVPDTRGTLPGLERAQAAPARHVVAPLINVATAKVEHAAESTLHATAVAQEGQQKLGNEEGLRTSERAVRELANQGRLSEALALCEQALAAEKLVAGLHVLHAMILQEQNNHEGAIASLKRALYLDPSHVLAHFTIGNILLRQGHARSSDKYFRNAMNILGTHLDSDVLSESDGLTVGRFKQIVHATMEIAS